MPQRPSPTSMLGAFVAAPQAVFSPVATYSAITTGSRPLMTLFGVTTFTALAASISAPITIHVLQTTPEIAASPAAAQNFALVHNVVLTPLGTVVFLLTMSTIVWAVSLVVGCEITYSQSASIVFIAGVVAALKRLFVAVVLYARWWWFPASLNKDITTGLDGFISPERAATFPISVLGAAGLFEVWFCLLIAVGLEFGGRLRRRAAAAIATLTGFVLVGSKLLIVHLLPT